MAVKKLDTVWLLKLVTFGLTVIALVLPLTSNFPTQNPVNSVLPKVNAGCVTFSPVPVVLVPFSNVTLINCSDTLSLFPLNIVYLYLGIHTYHKDISSSVTSSPTFLVTPLFNTTAFAHCLSV